MNPSDFDALAKYVYINLDQINRHLTRAKFASKFYSNGPDSTTDFPGELLALAKEDESHSVQEVQEMDLLERPNEEEIDTLFETIRARTSTTGSKHQRHGSVKKTTAAPLQQSKLLNETNLIAISTTSLTNSSTDLSGTNNKTTIAAPPKVPAVDVDALVHRFRQLIDTLAAIEYDKIQAVDLSQIRQQFRNDWAKLTKTCRNVETMLDEFKQRSAEPNGSGVVKKELVISNELVKSVKQLQSKLHYAMFIKKLEVLPDLTKTLSKEVFQLSECLDAIDETIRQKQL